MSLFEGTKKILVIKLRHIGDVLLTVPAIRALKETFPNVAVSALVNSGTEEMLTLNPLLDSVICYDRGIKGASLDKRVPAELRFAAEVRKMRFDMTVDLTGGDRPALLGFLSGARYRLGYRPGAGFVGKKYLYTHLAEPPAPGARTHTVMRDLGLVREFGIDTANLAVDIYTEASDDDFVDGVLKENGFNNEKPLVHVHPTSRWSFKCWTDASMARVLDELDERGMRVVLTTGPDESEIERVRSIIGFMDRPPIDLSGRLSLKHLASLSRRAALFLGPDSAPMHVAAAVGTPLVGIFGPSGAFDWGPWDNHAASSWDGPGKGEGTPYTARAGVQRFGANTVIQKDWDCVPCGHDGCEGTKKSRCLDELDWSEVMDVIDPIVAELVG